MSNQNVAVTVNKSGVIDKMKLLNQLLLYLKFQKIKSNIKRIYMIENSVNES